ncbi:MAG: PAS domain S-box protein [Chloroflexi bacterium]|nr:PAS domain S-box protein [Chloroflexota bacterium]
MSNKPKILIVDDKVENLIALEKILSDLDVDFVRATSGNEALAHTLEYGFAIALVDVQMPQMDGFETVELMRHDKKNRYLPIIFVSAIYKEDYYLVKGIEKGAVDFITKPIVPEILLGKVRIFLELHEYRTSLENEIECRIESEERLRESEEKYRSIIENIQDIYYRTDLNGNLVMISPSGVKLSGYDSVESMLGLNISETFYADPLKRDELLKALENGNVYNYEITLKKRDGTLVPVIASGHYYYDTLNNPLGFEGLIVDITDRKRIEEALRHSEEYFRFMIENSSDMIVVLDADGTIRYTSPSIKHVAGYEPEDLIGKNAFDFVHPKETEKATSIFIEGLAIPGYTAILETRLQRKNGDWRYVELTGKNLLDEPAIQGVVLNFHDIDEHIKAEKEIRESEEKFRTIFESANDVIAYVDESGVFIDVNSKAEEIFGWKPEEVIGKSFTDFPLFKPETINYVLQRFSNAILDHTAQYVVLEAQRKDGNTLFIEVGTAFIKRNDGTRGILVNLRDATERKKAEDALRESEEKFRTIFENVNDEIIYLNMKGVVIDVNDRVEDIFGWKREEVIGSVFTEYMQIEPDAYRNLTNLFTNAFKNRTESHITVQAKHRDGSTVFVEASSRLVNQDENLEGILIILRDITARKRDEELILQHNKELTALNDIAQTISQSFDLDRILNNTLDKTLQILNIENGIIALLDKEEKSLVLTVTRGATDEQIKDISPIKLEDSDIFKLMSESWEPVFLESIPDLLQSLPHKAISIATEQQLKSAMAVPLKARGELLGVMCSLTREDRVFNPEERELLVTIGHQIGTAIENALLLEEASRAEALEELDLLRTELLASVSHELRTPLTSIKGLASTLTQEDVEWDSETQKDFLKIIDRESDILTHIVEDLMQMSQMESGIMTMHKLPSSISAVVSQLSDHLKGLVRKHEFEMNISQGMPQIYADQIRIGQVITNLVSNAASYSEEGTRITLKAKSQNGSIVVSVSDQGIGIANQHIGMVFDRFYRLESGIARRRGGTGLGLAICKGIVEGHDGKIWVESKLGEGSKFSFSIPILQDAPTRSQNRKTVPTYSHDGGTQK